VVLPGLSIDVIMGMNWISQNGVLIDTSTRVVMLRDPTDQKGFLVQLPRKVDLSGEVHAVQAKALAEIPVVNEFLDVFPMNCRDSLRIGMWNLELNCCLARLPSLGDLIGCLRMS
jgi:hypothetical protein